MSQRVDLVKRWLGIVVCAGSLSIGLVPAGNAEERNPREGGGRVEGKAPREEAQRREEARRREEGQRREEARRREEAQRREKGREGGERRAEVEVRGDRMQALGFLGNPAVHRELNLTADQVNQLRELAGQLVEAHRSAAERSANIRGEGAAERRGEIAETTQRRIVELQGRLPEILNEKQLKRYRELELQSSNMVALGNEQVARNLNLSDDQIEELKTLWRESNQKLSAAGRGEKAGEMQRNLTAEFNEKASAILTAEQREQFEKMKGEPFRAAAEEVRGQGDRPREGGDKPREGGDRPREGGDKPREGRDRPREGGDRPREGGDKPRAER